MSDNDLTQTQQRPVPVRTPREISLEAQRHIVENLLADDLQDQAMAMLERVRSLRKGQAFDATAVQKELQVMLGNDLALLGQLQALAHLEHPGSASFPPILRGRRDGAS